MWYKTKIKKKKERRIVSCASAFRDSHAPPMFTVGAVLARLGGSTITATTQNANCISAPSSPHRQAETPFGWLSPPSSAGDDEQVVRGKLFLSCGPSGAGKDTCLSGAQRGNLFVVCFLRSLNLFYSLRLYYTKQ